MSYDILKETLVRFRTKGSDIYEQYMGLLQDKYPETVNGPTNQECQGICVRLHHSTGDLYRNKISGSGVVSEDDPEGEAG